MAKPGEHVIGGGTNARPLKDTVAETGPGEPDDAIGPEDRTIPELTELANSEEGRRIEQKLRAEAQARRSSSDDDTALEDPTGHA
jgi:hypothetical protein